MKPAVFSICCVVCFLCAGAQKSYVDAASAIPPHPRLLLLSGEEKTLWKNIQGDKTWKMVHESIIAECDRMLGMQPVERIKIGIRLLDKSREALRRVYCLSYAWRMTGDKKYFLRCEKELLAVAAFSDWNPTHYLDVAEMTMAVAIGYDWLYNDLSQQSRIIIQEAILTKGLETSFDTVHFNHYRKWLSVTNNWNQVCNSGLSFGAIAIFESHPALAAKLINRSIESIAIPMNEAYGKDGAYPEGYIYWGYGTTMNVMFLDLLEKAFKTDFGLTKAPGFLKTPYYVQNMVAPSGNSFNYSDETQQAQVQSAMFWFAGRLKDPSLLWQEKKMLAGAKQSQLGGDRLLPSLILWGNKINTNQIPVPVSTSWMGQGANPVAAFRTSWTDSNAIYLGLKAGSAFVTHGHMDIGSFVMEADGERWAMDFGMQEYESLESKKIDLWNNKQEGQRWEIFRYNNFTHNTLTVNQQLQLVDGYAPITAFSGNAMFMQASTDLSSVYKNELAKAARGVAIVQKKYVVIRDELETLAKPALVRWTMLTDAEVKIKDNHTIELHKNGKTLQLLLQDEGAAMKTWVTNPPPHDYDAPNPGTTLVGFEINIPANVKRAITVLLVPQQAGKISPEAVAKLSEWPNTLH